MLSGQSQAQPGGLLPQAGSGRKRSGGKRSVLPSERDAWAASLPFLHFLILSKSGFKGGPAIDELDHLAPFIQRNVICRFFCCCWAEAAQVWNKATPQPLLQLFADGHTDTLKAPVSEALKICSTNEQGLEKGPCSVILETDPPLTMVTSPQVGPTFSICNSNPRRERRGQDGVLDYICEVTIAMQS